MQRLLKPQVIVPLLVFIFSLTYSLFLSWLGNCPITSMDCWSRWDSGLYIDIAAMGHTLVLCGPETGWPAEAGAWCGNAGWAPLYPLMIRVLHNLTGMDYLAAGWLLTRIFYLCFLFTMAALMVKDFSLRSWLPMILVAVAPGHIYGHAVFPISLILFLIALLFYFLLKQKWLLAGLVSGIAVWAYSTGFVLMGCTGIFVLYLWKMHGFRYAFVTGIKLMLLPVISIAGLFFYDHLATGHWDAMFLVQKKYGHGLQSTFKLMGLHWQKLLQDWGTMKMWVEIQNFTIVFLLIAFVFYLLKRTALALEYRIVFLAFAVIFWFFPYSLGIDVSLYRNVALLSPLLFLIKDVQMKWQWLLFAIFVTFSIPLGILFIQSVII